MPNHPEIRSEEIQDIMQRTPGWLTRWGITVLLTIVGAVLLGAFYVAYPDSVDADVLIQARSRPLTIKASATRKVRQFLVQDRHVLNAAQAILIWHLGDTLHAPIGGRLYWLKAPAPNSEVGAGEALAVIIPTNRPYRISGRLPVAGSGKVVVGQRAIIRLAAYPSREFGTLSARVASLSPIEENGFYAVEFSLSNGLITPGGQQIPIVTQLRGKVEILTTERSLLSRIFEII